MIRGTNNQESVETLFESLKKEVILLESYFSPEKFNHHAETTEEIKETIERSFNNAKKFINELKRFVKNDFYQKNMTEIDSFGKKLKYLEEHVSAFKKPYERHGKPSQYARKLERDTTEKFKQEICELIAINSTEDSLERALLSSKAFCRNPNAAVLEFKRQRGDFKSNMISQGWLDYASYALSYLPGYTLFKNCKANLPTADNAPLLENNSSSRLDQR